MVENSRLNVRLKIFPTPEQATAAYSGIAREALAGSPAFEQMDEAKQAIAIGDTAYLIASTLFKYGGHLQEKGSDAAWSSFSQPFSKRTQKASPIVVRFRLSLGGSAEGVYKTAFTMLAEGVTTREALAQKEKAPPDLLEGMHRMWLSPKAIARKRREGGAGFPEFPSQSELIELTAGK